MNKKLQFDEPIHVAVVPQYGEASLDLVRSVLGPNDRMENRSGSDLANLDGIDLVVATPICGSAAFAQEIAAARVPTFALHSTRSFHPYHAAFYRQIERHGGILLPAMDPEEIASSVRAVRARKALARMKLIAVGVDSNGFGNEALQEFVTGARKHLGVEILIRGVREMKERAAGYDDPTADRELQRWYAEVLEGPGEMDGVHMRQVARLYLAQRAMLEETGAVGITVDDIGGFLGKPDGIVMPNVGYGPLVADGFLACEERDIEALTSELLLYAGLGAHPTMSNIYFAFRDRFTALENHEQYTAELELEDCRQCFADNHVTAAHFSTSGVLPPAMMEEARYSVREALPSWPGQSMIASTPKLGPVVMARLSIDASAIHIVPGDADGVVTGDHYGWYRGRWFVRIPDARDFARRCLFQHYAIGPVPGTTDALDTLCHRLLGLQPA